ncbi:hypothetical protein [Paludibacterium denitrificans]|uniref:Uncharacterized protein n=1 Tax=Paludibacterium denitrificans TaxID=2675226 RepID=A0A844GEC4_9NEIS|nr:hypothetical protein [Paludibacterium denitrificans]MTD33621.1 hypothetical protein [Paludibacterium denitrificans]
MATMLIVLLVGMAMTATAMTVYFRVRGAQDMQMSVHATTQAQIKAWEGVQALTQALNNTSVVGAVYTQVSGGSCPSVSVNMTGVSAAITSCNSSTKQLTAAVTGTSGPATSTVQVIYQLTQSGTTGSSSTTISPAVTINGDLSYTGGGMSFMNGAVLANIAVNGNISVSNGSSANLAGCSTGNINLSGGGIASGSTLSALGDITISNMTALSNVTLAAKDISISGTGNATYNAITAGAYNVNVYSDGTLIGTANVGGTLSGSTVTSNSSSINVTLTSGGSTTYSYPTNNGHTISLTYNSVYGGVISMGATGTVTTMWGNTISIANVGAGTYTTLKSNSDISMYTNTITNFIGGGNLTVNASTLPTISNGKLVGKYTNTAGNSAKIPNLVTGVDASNAPVCLDYRSATLKPIHLMSQIINRQLIMCSFWMLRIITLW